MSIWDEIPYYRLRGADEALRQAQEMTANQYIADTVLAYLQSGSFLFLWFGTIFTICGYLMLRRLYGKK